MKKILIMLCLMLVIPFVNSAIELNADSYNMGDTVLAKLTFVYPPNEIRSEHVSIIDKDNRKVMIPYYIVKFSDSEYYVYFTISSLMFDDNYTLSIGPYYYALNNKLEMKTDTALLKTEGRDGDTLSVDPAAIAFDFSTQNYFNLELRNNGENPLELKLKLTNGTLNYDTYRLQSKDYLKIKGTVEGPGSRVLEIFYNERLIIIPILVKSKTVVEKPVVSPTTIPVNAISFIEELDKINVSVQKAQILYGSVRFKNTWDKAITNVQLSLTGDLDKVVKLDKTSFSSVSSGYITTVNMVINENKDITKSYNGEIKLTANGVSASYPVYIYYTSITEETPEEIPEEQPVETVTEKQVVEQQDELNRGFLFSLIIIVVILTLIVWLVIKLGKKRKKDLLFTSRR